jgi:hypothetical protein
MGTSGLDAAIFAFPDVGAHPAVSRIAALDWASLKT